MPTVTYVIESCDDDEAQIFVDIIPAETPEAAVAKWTPVRGGYATIVTHVTLPEWIEAKLEEVKHLIKFLEPGVAKQSWKELKKEVCSYD